MLLIVIRNLPNQVQMGPVIRPQWEELMGKTKKTSKKDIDKFHEIEFEKIISATQTLYTTRVTAGGIVATVNLGILGAAFNSALTNLEGGLAASFFVVIGITIAFMIIDVFIKSAIAGHYLRSLELAKKFAPEDGRVLSSIFVISPKGQIYINSLLDVSDDIRRKK